MIDNLPAVIGIPLALALLALWFWLCLKPARAVVDAAPRSIADEVQLELDAILGEADRG